MLIWESPSPWGEGAEGRMRGHFVHTARDCHVTASPFLAMTDFISISLPHFEHS